MTIHNVLINGYQPSDRKQIIELMKSFGNYIESLDDLGRTHYKKGGAEYFTDKMVKEAKENQGKVYVARAGKKVIGFIGGYILRQGKDELMETIQVKPGKITELFVHPDYRKRKLGSGLIAKLENYFLSQRCNIVRTDVFAPNILARTFYAKQGYKERSLIVMKQLKK